MYYTTLALVVAALIALPLGVLIGNYGRGGSWWWTWPMPGGPWPPWALVPSWVVLLGFNSLTLWLLPLVVLAIPGHHLVNAYEGVAGVDPGPEGRRPAQHGHDRLAGSMRKVEIPVALPLIMLGLRTTGAIFVVATATIEAEIGLGGLAGTSSTAWPTQKTTARWRAAPCSWSSSRCSCGSCSSPSLPRGPGPATGASPGQLTMHFRFAKMEGNI